MHELSNNIARLCANSEVEKTVIVEKILSAARDSGYESVEINEQKPWGAYIRLDSSFADKFVKEFFPGLSSMDARLGNENAELSPKFLIVSPRHRLSWQYHNRRAERWAFLSTGGYERSMTDEESTPLIAEVGDVVQFAQGERHRLVGDFNYYTVVAEIWQHSDPATLSNEEDIVRLADDYSR